MDDTDDKTYVNFRPLSGLKKTFHSHIKFYAMLLDKERTSILISEYTSRS
jgi:hypothetical protein